MSVQDENRIATAFLRALDAPNTTAMRLAVRAWLRAEGISSVKRNNPWNLHSGAPCKAASGFCPGKGPLPGQIGRANVGPGDQNVAVFDTLEHGVQANANNLIRLRNAGYGYDLVIRKAQAGDAVGFLNALALSSWSYGRYGTRGGGRNKLLVIYNSLSGLSIDPFSYRSMPQYEPTSRDPIANRPRVPDGSGALTGNPLSRALERYRVAHNIDPDSLITEEQFWEAVADLPGMTPDNGEARQIMVNFVGRKWGGAGTLATDINKEWAQPDPLAAIGGLAAALADPAKWARILALIVGLGLAAYGGVNVYRATA